MPSQKWAVSFVGQAGQGVMTTGNIFARVMMSLGFEVFVYNEYPSLIKGGQNISQVSFAPKGPLAQADKSDVQVFLAKNLETPKALAMTQHNGVNIGIDAIGNEIGTSPEIVANQVALGMVGKLFGIYLEVLQQTVIAEFASAKKRAIVQQNVAALGRGWRAVGQKFKLVSIKNNQVKKQAKELYTGNQLVALGALKAGMSFFAGYPMTPATGILQTLVDLKKTGNSTVTVIQPEDEIAAVNMALGASFAGARAMVATSGGGFALMSEGLGLAGVTELPLVVVVSQRPGPATGMPTWTGQGDLRTVLHAGQDDFPRIVLAPTNHSECFSIMPTAFYLAEKYQLPVIVLLDKYLSESWASIDLGKVKTTRSNKRQSMQTEGSVSGYKRYRVTQNGVSVRTIPGVRGGEHLANSYEHDQYGWTSEDAGVRIQQTKKRMAKFITVASREMGFKNIIVEKQRKVGVIVWGSTAIPAREALARLPESSFKLLTVDTLFPFDKFKLRDFMHSAKRVVFFEGNITGQFLDLVKQWEGVDMQKCRFVPKIDGRPFFADEMITILTEEAKHAG